MLYHLVVEDGCQDGGHQHGDSRHLDGSSTTIKLGQVEHVTVVSGAATLTFSDAVGLLAELILPVSTADSGVGASASDNGNACSGSLHSTHPACLAHLRAEASSSGREGLAARACALVAAVAAGLLAGGALEGGAASLAVFAWLVHAGHAVGGSGDRAGNTGQSIILHGVATHTLEAGGGGGSAISGHDVSALATVAVSIGTTDLAGPISSQTVTFVTLAGHALGRG